MNVKGVNFGPNFGLRYGRNLIENVRAGFAHELPSFYGVDEIPGVRKFMMGTLHNLKKGLPDSFEMDLQVIGDTYANRLVLKEPSGRIFQLADDFDDRSPCKLVEALGNLTKEKLAEITGYLSQVFADAA